MLILRIPSWRLEAGKGDFYGWRYWLQVGPWLVLFWRTKREAA